MKFALRFPLLVFLFCLCCLVSPAQTYTTVSGSGVMDGQGRTLALGTFCLSPYNSSGSLVAITPSGGSPTTGPFCTPIVNGAFSAASLVPNLATASPSGLNYQVDVYNSDSTAILTVNWVTAITGSVWPFSGLTVPPSLSAQASASGWGTPYLPCLAGASYTITNWPGSTDIYWTCNLSNGYTQWFQGGNFPAPSPSQTATIPVVAQMIADALAGGSGGGGVPVGPSFSLQYNNSGAFGGASFNGLVKLSTAGAPTVASSSDLFSLMGGHPMLSLSTTGSGAATFDNTTGALNIPTGGSGGGGMSGQTPDYLPKATTTTTSTISSHFFDNASTAGLLNQGFLQQVNTPNCLNNGVTFTASACDEFDILNDGAVAKGSSRNMTGVQMSGQFYGPGGDGTSEGRTSTLFGNSFNAAFITPGIKLTQVSNMNHFGIGDSQGFQISEAMHAGTAYQSDQGSQLIYAWVGELGHWSGTVAAGGTNTLPKVTSSTAHSWCSSQQNQSCVGSPGGVMLDRSVVRATGTMTGACAGGPVAWMGSCPTNQTTLPITTVYGTALGINLTTGSTWDAPISRTITIGFGGGTGAGLFAAGDHACVIGDKFFEQRIITAVSGTAGTQTLTLPLSQTENSVFIAKGDCMYLTMDADQAHDIEMSTPSISLDGAHVLSSSPGFSMMFPVSATTPGDHWSRFDGGASSGFHLYAGARIDKIDTLQPTFNPWQDSMIVYTLEPNSAFNVGDAICSPDFYGQKVDGMELTAGQNQPGQVTGLRLHITGNGASSGSAALRFYNDEAIGSYTPWGGPLTEPAMMTQEGAGAFSATFSGNYTPLDSVLGFSNHQPGQTSYYLLNDPSWGRIQVTSDSALHYDGANGLILSNGVTAGGGASFGAPVTVGKNTATSGYLDVRNDGGSGNQIIGRFAGSYQGYAAGSLEAQVRLGITNSGSNFEVDKGYWGLRDDGGGHQGMELGRFDNGGGAITALYMSPDEQGQNLSIMNGHANCPDTVCLGSNLRVTSAGNLLAFGTGRNLFGVQGWTKTTPTSAASSLTLDNGGSDTPNLTFYYANNHNFSMDSADTAAGGFGTCTTAGNILRFITDADETGGAVRLCMDSVGNTAITGGFQATSLIVTGATATVNGKNICLADGTNCPAAGASLPLYNTSGTLQTSAHSIIGTGTLAANSLTITLSGSAVFSSSSSYACTAHAGASGATVSIGFTYTSGTSFTILSDAATPTVRYTCIGN